MANTNDTKLWNSFKEGDSEAFNQIYDLYIDQLYSFGMYYFNDSDFVMDCIHDLFLDIHKYRKKISETDNIKLYLLKSLKRKLFKTKKKSMMIPSIDNLDLKSIPAEMSAEENIIAAEAEGVLFKKVEEGLEQLSDKQREILSLRYNSELSYEDISDILGISIESSRTQVYRSLKLLRGKINPKSQSSG